VSRFPPSSDIPRGAAGARYPCCPTPATRRSPACWCFGACSLRASG
jgi:hypothetical protein